MFNESEDRQMFYYFWQKNVNRIFTMQLPLELIEISKTLQNLCKYYRLT